MMKFELARKYLVGFLALAVLTMSLTLPLSAPIAPVAAADLNAGPIVNADDTTITLVRTSSPLKPLTATDTVHTLTASILLGGSVIPDTSTYWVIFKVTLSASVVGSKTVIVPPGVGTATVSFVPSDLNPTPTITTTYQCTAFWVETNTTVADPNRAASGVADLVWQARAAATVAIDPPTATNTFPVITHTVTLVVKDQFNELFTFSGTITLGVSGSLTPTPASQGVPFTATHTATTTYTVTLPDGLCIAPSPGHWHDNLTATATFPVVGTKATATATKTWTYTPSYDELCLQPATQEKVAGQLATIKAVFCDQYNYWISKTGTVTWTASGPNHPTTAPVTGTGTYLALTYTGTQVGLDTITASAVFPDEVYFATDDQKTATVTWTADAGYHLVLQHVLAGTTTTATTVTNTVGYTHYLRATVTDTYGNVAPDGVTVTFAITAGPHTAIAIPSGVTAGGTGIVNTSYTALTPGDDTIQATANGSKSNEIIKSWHVGLPYTINLLPIDHITSVGDTHEVKAWVKDWCANLLNGVSVSFLVTNAHIRNGSATTDINGIASWTYTETTTGLDLIQASCPGSAGAPPATDLGADLLLGTIPSGTGTVYSNVSNNLWVWGTVTTIVLSPTSGINSLGATHKLIATVTNEFGKLMNGFPVLFTVTGSHPKTFTSNTDINGEATWSWIETTPGIDSIVASCGGINSNTAAKQWANRVITTITPTLGTTAYSATNNVSDGNTTHTITVWVRDQFGDAVTNTALNLVRTGANPKTAATGLTNGSGVLVYVYTNAYSGPASASGILGSDTNVFTGGTATATFTKVWTYTATYGSTTVPDKSTHYNYLNTTHTVTVNFYDQYSMSISATYSLYLYANSATVGTSKPFTGTGTFALLTYSSTTAGIDVLTISGTVANNAVGSRTQGIAAGTKCWANVPSVEPDNAVNALGATHEFVIKGVPGETVVVSFSSAGIFDLHNLSLTKIEPTGYAIEPTGSLPIPVANINHIHVLLDGTGSATIYVMSQAPGKFYMDTWFTELFSDLGRTSALPVIKRSKAYAELHWLDITPPDINPVTQVPTWDVHTVTVTVKGEFPVKPATEIIPGQVPPEGGNYIIVGGNELWAVNVPIADVKVGWDVRWNLTKDGLIDIWADRWGDSAIAPPANPDLYPPNIAANRGANLHQDGSALTPIHDLWATSYTNAAGQASLTYHMEYSATATWGTGVSRTCTFYWPCFVDSITATAAYIDPHLSGQYGTISATTSKEWRDHAFKLIKYNGHLPIGSNDYIIGAKFFLRRMDLVGTPTYVPPMYDSTGVIGWSPWNAPMTNYPGNAYIVAAVDSHNALNLPGVVTTDTYGEAIWFHLPHGVYGLYEYSVPAPYALKTGKLFEFTINAAAPYWCGPEPKITIRYEVNTPTGPNFHKLTYCGTRMAGVTFEVTNLDTSHMHSYVTDVNGMLVVTASDFTPYYDTTWGTDYKVHEVSNAALASYGVVAVPDFYFNISKTGVWDQNFYDSPFLGKSIVWPLTTLPWAWDPGTPRHWVVDPQASTPTGPLAMSNPTTSPTSGVASYRPVIFSATSNLTGTWSGFVYNALGVKTGTLAAGSGTLYAPSWAPGADQQALTGNGYYAILQVVAGTETVTKMTPLFDVYNWQAKILSVELWNSSLTAIIVNPTAGVDFFVKVTIKNVTLGIITTAVVPIMLGSSYLGAGALGGLPAGAEGSVAVLANKPAGTYACSAFAWPSFGGAPIAPAFPFSITVNP